MGHEHCPAPLKWWWRLSRPTAHRSMCSDVATPAAKERKKREKVEQVHIRSTKPMLSRQRYRSALGRTKRWGRCKICVCMKRTHHASIA